MRNIAQITSLVAVCFIVLLSRSSYAEGMYALRPVPGYKCMSLNISEKDMMDFHSVVPIYAKPSNSSPQVGQASSIVFVASPEVAVAGYVKVKRLDDSVGWIDARYVVPWHSPDGRPHQCTPSYMSKGGLGSDIR